MTTPQPIENLVEQAVRRAVAPLADYAGPSFTTAQAAAYLGISVRLLERLVSDGSIRVVRITPRCRRFLRETLDAYLRSSLR